MQSDIDPELDNNYLKLNIAEVLDFDGDESDGGEEPDDGNGVLGLSRLFSTVSDYLKANPPTGTIAGNESKYVLNGLAESGITDSSDLAGFS